MYCLYYVILTSHQVTLWTGELSKVHKSEQFSMPLVKAKAPKKMITITHHLYSAKFIRI